MHFHSVLVLHVAEQMDAMPYIGPSNFCNTPTNALGGDRFASAYEYERASLDIMFVRFVSGLFRFR